MKFFACPNCRVVYFYPHPSLCGPCEEFTEEIALEGHFGGSISLFYVDQSEEKINA